MENNLPSERLATTWTDFVSRRWRGVDRPASNVGKVALDAFMRVQKIPNLKVIKVFPQASAVSLEGLPAFFVFKPASLWSGTGVRLIHKIAGLSRYFDAKNDVVLTEEQIREGALRIEDKLGRKLSFIVEQRALDEDAVNTIPLDYKVFTFYGVPKFVLQVDRNVNPPRMAFFDENFEPIVDERVQLNPGKPETRGTHRRPKCWQGILEVASLTTLKLISPFISVDCYATPDGPVVGELTHTPGGPWYGNMYSFSQDFDRELGAAWQAANERLGFSKVFVKVPYQITSNGKVLKTIT